MESHRRRIEADHNEGLPESEWETMEEILDGFMRDYRDARLCAMSYDVQYSEFAQWWHKRKGTGLSLEAYSAAVSKRSSTYRMRIHRGMDPEEAERVGPATPTERAKKAAYARWDRRAWR